MPVVFIFIESKSLQNAFRRRVCLTGMYQVYQAIFPQAKSNFWMLQNLFLCSPNISFEFIMAQNIRTNFP